MHEKPNLPRQLSFPGKLFPSFQDSGLEVPLIRVRFHSFELDPDSGELWKGDVPVRLPPQPTKVLRLLVERAGSLVTRKDMQKALWQGETFVDFDQGLNYCIRQIRIALEDNAEQPIFIATVPRRGYRFVAPVTPILPPTPFPPAPPPQTTAPEPPLPPPPPVSPTPSRRRRTPLILILLAIPLLGGLINLAVRRGHLVKTAVSADVPAGSVDTPPRTSVAVLGFANLDGKESDAWLSTALSEMFATELSEGGKLRLVSGEEVARARTGLEHPGSLSQDTLDHLRQQLGADVIVLGSYTVLAQNHANKLRLDLRLQDARDGHILASFAQTRDASDLFDLVSSTGSTLRQKLGAGNLSPVEEASFDHSFPTNPEARRLYAEGIEKLQKSDALGARESLEQAAKLEPPFAPAHSALAAAWSALGYDAKAADEARKAVDLASNLSREEQLSIEATYFEMAQDRPRAIDKLHTLTAFFPDDLNYGIRLATVQLKADQNDAALATLARLRKLPSPLGTNPRLDILEAQIHGAAGDFKQANALAETAVRKGKSIGAQLIVAQALLVEASNLERLGLPDASLQASSEARKIDTDANFPKGIGLSLLFSGDVLYDKGDFNGARSNFEEAMSLFREIGDKKNQGLTFERIGNTFHDQGKFTQSQDQYKRALDTYREIQWSGGISSAIGNLANTLDALGDLKGSLKMHQDALQIFNQTANKREIASETNNIAFVQQELGDLPAAADGHRKALALHQQTGHQRGQMFALSGLGDVFLMQGDLPGARKQYETARAIAEKTQADAYVALMDEELAAVDLVEHHLAEGEARAHHAIAQFEKDKDPEGAAQSYSELVEILLAENKLPEALAAGKLVEINAAQVTSLPPQFEAALALAQLEAATGKKEAARKRLVALLDHVRRCGYLSYTLEASRALAGLESGKLRSTHLQALSQDARRKGYGLLPLEIASMPAPAEIANR